jgi:hypothetical protein
LVLYAAAALASVPGDFRVRLLVLVNSTCDSTDGQREFT